MLFLLYLSKRFKMINEVRNAVLSVLNKNNYGYISPSDFNLYAANAQMELYEEYYSSYNKTINAENLRSSGTDYADIESPLAETLETFLVTDYLSNLGGNSFSIPTVTTVGNDSYYILKVLCYPNVITSGSNTSSQTNILLDTSASFLSSGISVGDIVVNRSTDAVSTVVQIISNTSIALSSNIFPLFPVGYRIISSVPKEADKVSVGKITMLNS